MIAQKQPKPPFMMVQDQPDQPSATEQEPAESRDSNVTWSDDSFT